jgi:hypothetical protein
MHHSPRQLRRESSCYLVKLSTWTRAGRGSFMHHSPRQLRRESSNRRSSRLISGFVSGFGSREAEGLGSNQLLPIIFANDAVNYNTNTHHFFSLCIEMRPDKDPNSLIQ